MNVDDYICPDTLCAPVIGDVLVFRDKDHLTATYARSLAAAIGQAQIERVVDVP